VGKEALSVSLIKYAHYIKNDLHTEHKGMYKFRVACEESEHKIQCH